MEGFCVKGMLKADLYNLLYVNYRKIIQCDIIKSSIASVL